ncbi:MAG: DUF4235 domain-containing protein [Bacteroidota bacterium]
MKDKYKRQLKVMAANGTAVLGAILLKRGMEKLLKLTLDKKPPKKPDKYESVTWGEALVWASLTGAMTGALKLFIRRGDVDKIF